jgi:hypothetical protein
VRWVIIGILLVCAIVGGLSAKKIHYYYIKSQLDPQVELTRALNNMAAVTKYRYDLLSTFTVDGRKEVISKVTGEKEDGNTHIKGEMVNTPVDIYYVDRTIYNYDATAEKWLVIPSSTSNSEELLISELNPMSNFRLKNINTINKVGFEEIDGTDCLLVSCKALSESELLETMWKDSEYRLWIDFQNGTLTKAEVNTTNKQVPSTKLNITVNFFDLNQEIKIEPPDTTVKN